MTAEQEQVDGQGWSAETAASALEHMRATCARYWTGYNSDIQTAALVAIAEQLATLNEHLSDVADAARLYGFINS